ncbi:hypothetical protein HMPREF9466_02741, partial [Fusobacterium necrophorum subsp. funduliforme 1_1_36S]
GALEGIEQFYLNLSNELHLDSVNSLIFDREF